MSAMGCGWHGKPLIRMDVVETDCPVRELLRGFLHRLPFFTARIVARSVETRGRGSMRRGAFSAEPSRAGKSRKNRTLLGNAARDVCGLNEKRNLTFVFRESILSQ